MVVNEKIFYFTEIGVTLREDSMIRYDFAGSWRSTIAENIRVGFTTTHPQGFLLGLFSNKSGEYMTLMVSNSGKINKKKKLQAICSNIPSFFFFFFFQ